MTCRESFDHVPVWIEEFLTQCEAPVFIVGNKIEKEGRVVTEEMAEELSKQHGNSYYSFVDAEHNIYITELVEGIVRVLSGEEFYPSKHVKSARKVVDSDSEYTAI